MLTSLIVVCVIAILACGCWVSAERDLRRVEERLVEVRRELNVVRRSGGVVLQAIDGGGLTEEVSHGNR